MDPNENLKQQLALARKIIEMADSIKDPSELEGDEPKARARSTRASAISLCQRTEVTP